MTTGYESDTEFGVVLRDNLPDGAVGPRPQPARLLGRSVMFDIDEQAEQPAHASATQATGLSVHLRRSLRTLAPFLIADLIALMISGLLGQMLLWMVSPTMAGSLGWAAAIALWPLIPVYWLGGLYSEIWVHPVIELRQLSHSTTVALLAAAAGGMVAWPAPLWFLAAWCGAIILVPLCRVLLRRVCQYVRGWGFPTLVIAVADDAEPLAQMLLKNPRSGLRPVLLSDPEGKCRASLLPVMNDARTLESIVRSQGIQHAVVCLPGFSNARLAQLIDRYAGLVPHLLVLSDISTLPTLWSASRSGGRLSGIEVRNGLLLATLQLVKRVIDLSIAAVVLLLGLPLMLIVAAVVRLTSDGPLFFGHTRIGMNGRMFKAWKFRTMHRNADEMLRAYLQEHPEAREEWELTQKLRDDPRVTSVGKFLRMASLDELPQLWNVLCGDMSLVGPRPIVKDEVVRYGHVFRLYTTVKPGITGMWQVSGRTDLGYDERVVLDKFYVHHWSPWLDVYILAKTVVALLNRRGAY